MSYILKSKVKVALIQLVGSTPDKLANLKHAKALIDNAMQREPETKIVVLPECFNSPYDVTQFAKYSEVIEDPEAPSVNILKEIAKTHAITLIGGSIPERDPANDSIYNTCLIINEEGSIIAKHRKLHLFDIDIPNKITFKESITLTGGDKVTMVDTKYGKIGVGICYDLRFPEMAMIAARKGAFAMIYPGAFNTVTGPLHWQLLARARSVDNQIYTLLCSPARVPGSPYQAWGHSLCSDPSGKILCEADINEEIIFIDLDPEVIETTRGGIPITTQRRFDVYPDVSSK